MPIKVFDLSAMAGWIPLLLFLLFVASVVAALIFEIIRQTAEGGDVMEGSPDFGDFGPRFAELLSTFVLGFVPAALAGFVTYLR